MSFLDRIPGLRKKVSAASAEHIMMPESLSASLVRSGKWVFHVPTQSVGILTAVHDFPMVRVMLTQDDGTDLRPISCSLTELRLARITEIPAPRRPSPEAGAALGYHA